MPLSPPAPRSFALLLAAFGLLCFLLADSNPWNWPSLDMASYYLSLQRPGFIQNDFFTSCFSADNGRILFGKITSIPLHFGLDWYQSLYLLMLLNSAAMPAALFLGLRNVLPDELRGGDAVLILVIGFAIVFPAQIDHLTVGWWRGWGNYFHPSAFCITALFTGSALAGAGGRAPISISSLVSATAGVLLIFLAWLLHPAYALGGSLLLSGVALAAGRRGLVLVLLLGGGLAMVFLKMTMYSGTLPLEDYYRYFIQMHPEHYLPSHFVAMGGFHWSVPFLVISGSCALMTLLCMRAQQPVLARICFFLLCFYAGSLALHHVLVEKFPLFKTLLLIGPVRFLAYGYWVLALLAVIAGRLLVGPCNRITGSRIAGLIPGLARCRSGRAAMLLQGLTLLFMVAAVPWGMHHLQPASRMPSAEERALLDWLAVHSRPGDVIIAPPSSMLPVAIPLLTGRGSYTGNGFPFEDSCLKENYQRYTNVYGSPAGPRGRRDAGEFYDRLDLSRLADLTPPADFIIVRQNSATAHQHGPQWRPLFQTRHYAVHPLRGAPSASGGQ